MCPSLPANWLGLSGKQGQDDNMGRGREGGQVQGVVVVVVVVALVMCCGAPEDYLINMAAFFPPACKVVLAIL